MSFSTYITTWDIDPLQQVQDMINKNVLTANTRVIMAFASFNFASADYIPGFGSITIEKTQQVVNLVHSRGGKISLSVGGATYAFYGSDLYLMPGFLADNINAVLTKCGFDGVDFDIEDNSANVPANFATQAASLINTLRSINGNLHITLTTAAQAWAAGCYQEDLIDLSIGNLDAWQPMEYDLWLASGVTYLQQIQDDINFYVNSWGVSPTKIVLGLMPGKDDLSRNLSLQDALNATAFSIQKGCQGVMIWDADNDGKGEDGNAPYAYSMGIQSMLNKSLKHYGKHLKKMGIAKRSKH